MNKRDSLLISIIVPFRLDYGADLPALLASIAGQTGVDWATIEIILVNDAGPDWDGNAAKDYPSLHVTQYRLPTSGGAGVARQYGMDRANGRYLMFMDADDALWSQTALSRFVGKVTTASTPPDLIRAPFLEELWQDNQLTHVTHPTSDGQSPVAKLIRADFVKKLGLRWHPELRVYEDSYFVNLLVMFAKHKQFLTEPVYLWKANPDSTGRSGEGFKHQADQWVKSIRLKLQFIRPRSQARWEYEFFDFVGLSYLHTMFFKPADYPALERELRLILTENRDLWQRPGVEALGRQVAEHYRGVRPYYRNVSMKQYPLYYQKLQQLGQ